MKLVTTVFQQVTVAEIQIVVYTFSIVELVQTFDDLLGCNWVLFTIEINEEHLATLPIIAT